jgi:hypothetical protein
VNKKKVEEHKKEIQTEKKLKLPFVFKLGVAFIIISPLRYLILLGVPFLPYSKGVRLGVGSAVFFVAEMLFWIGVFIVGEEVVRKYKEYLNPKRYFKRKNKR